ncbi:MULTISPECIES: carbamoyl-phosphate synthase [unclassified Prochlorococcus]|uniref:carbamoyl-phosphate synthase n=1 Tax=unclassified Prochlorococcus TaxID=2627481 RepID=UPI0005339AA8|nr:MULTISPECIES: carbamoyl-phosphate synthase [unclassified Prochlorococcus]KGG27090.1 hypothetical protein EV13_2236 [Prochlorococcus sp. MIT 0702]KGG27188.1 hypothetical protein EV12_1327 [Prochlorococcus sp. MIT 0701]KGG35478.1 hypothetical protein EV14_0865 [Prochlorococcus sp. MIT 0703]
MQRSLRLSLSLTGVAALALVNTPIQPVAAQEEGGSASDLGVMEINLKDVVQFNWGFQGALQGAGTPNQAGIGAFLPIAVGENSVWFIDALANANFSDYDNYSSIINTEVAGTTISTSTRLGYRWLNGDRSWMYGVNAGYDSRPMNTGDADTGVTVWNKDDVFFQQIAAGLEAISDTWNFNAYALIPVGDTEQRLNSRYLGGALDTYGLDVGYFITAELNASVGYYYQSGDLGTADGSGVQVELDYQIADGLTAGINVSYDEAFETRVSGNISYRFGSNSSAAETKKKAWQKPTIQVLSESVKNRNIRVHDVRQKKHCTDPTLGNEWVGLAYTSVVLNPSAPSSVAKFHCVPGAPAGGWTSN